MYPRRLGAGRCGAASSLRPVNTERAEAQRYGGFQDLGHTHLCNIPPGFIVLAKARRCTKREGRACRVRWEDGRRRGAAATSASLPRVLQKPSGRAGARPSHVLNQYDNPIISRPLSIRSFPVPLQWVKQRASQPQNQSPCPRASARSVLTGRRPRAVPAPPRRVAPGGNPEPPAGQHGARGDTKVRRVAHISATFRLVSFCWTRLGGVRNGRDALVASVCGTQMLRMRRFGKDRCGYDARNTGLRHNRSLPRCRAGIDGPVHLASTIIRSFSILSSG